MKLETPLSHMDKQKLYETTVNVQKVLKNLERKQLPLCLRNTNSLITKCLWTFQQEKINLTSKRVKSCQFNKKKEMRKTERSHLCKRGTTTKVHTERKIIVTHAQGGVIDGAYTYKCI